MKGRRKGKATSTSRHISQKRCVCLCLHATRVLLSATTPTTPNTSSPPNHNKSFNIARHNSHPLPPYNSRPTTTETTDWHSMKNDATEAALGLLGLSESPSTTHHNHVFSPLQHSEASTSTTTAPTIPRKRPFPASLERPKSISESGASGSASALSSTFASLSTSHHHHPQTQHRPPPPPPLPKRSPAPSSPTKPRQYAPSSSSALPRLEEVSTDAINCICGYSFDDGFSIACDNCSRWCHAACFEITDPAQVPEEWHCWVCAGTKGVDREKARRVQRERLKTLQAAGGAAGSTAGVRDAGGGMVNGNGHGHGYGGRETSPGTQQQKKAKRRRASVHQDHPQPSQVDEDEHVEIEEAPPTSSYVPIFHNIFPHPGTKDRLRRQAQHWRGVTALSSPSSPPPATHPFDSSPVHFSSLPSATSTSIHPLRSDSLPANGVLPPTYATLTTSPIPSTSFITPFTSTVIPSSSYLSDPLNAYAHHGMPKPFVHLLGPPLDVALDARVAGDEGRFVRSGCRPNAVLRPVICEESKEREREKVPAAEEGDEPLTFGVFALRDLKANEEVVLGWEWDDGNAIHALPALIETPHLFS